MTQHFVGIEEVERWKYHNKMQIRVSLVITQCSYQANVNQNGEAKSCCTIVFLLLAEETEEQKEVHRSFWVRDWAARMSGLGVFNGVMKELAIEDTNSFKEFVRMDLGHFNCLVTLVSPLIAKEDTCMREAIAPAE